MESLSVYEIDPRRFPKARGYAFVLVVFWLVWTPLTLVMTWLLLAGEEPLFLALWCALAWLGVVLIPLGLARMNRRETLTAAGDRLIVSGVRLLRWDDHVLHRDDLEALCFGHYGSGRDAESVHTLNLIQRLGCRPRRVMLAAFVHPTGKALLFEELRAFLVANGFSSLEFRDERDPASGS